jgi:hypothetical protein
MSNVISFHFEHMAGYLVDGLPDWLIIFWGIFCLLVFKIIEKNKREEKAEEEKKRASAEQQIREIRYAEFKAQIKKIKSELVTTRTKFFQDLVGLDPYYIDLGRKYMELKERSFDKKMNPIEISANKFDKYCRFKFPEEKMYPTHFSVSTMSARLNEIEKILREFKNDCNTFVKSEADSLNLIHKESLLN